MSTLTVKNTFLDVLDDDCDDFDVGLPLFSRGITEPALSKLRQCLFYAPASEKAGLVDVVSGESRDPEDVESQDLSDTAHMQFSSECDCNGVPLGLTEMKYLPLATVRTKEPPSFEEGFSRLATPSDPFTRLQTPGGEFTRLQTPGGEFTRLVTQDPFSDMDFRSCPRLPLSPQRTETLEAVPSTRGGPSPQGREKKFGAGTEVKIAPPSAQSRSPEETSKGLVKSAMGKSPVMQPSMMYQPQSRSIPEETAKAPVKSAMGPSPVMQPSMMYQPQMMMMMPWSGTMLHMQQQQLQMQRQEDGYSGDNNKRQRKKAAKPMQSQFRARPSLIDMAMNQKRQMQTMLEEQNKDDPVVGSCRFCSGEIRSSFKFCRYCGGAANQ